MQGAISFRVLHFFCSSVPNMLILYHQPPAHWSGLFNYLIVMPNIGGGLKFFWRGGHIYIYIWGGGL
jgi:hypothetical protein